MPAGWSVALRTWQERDGVTGLGQGPPKDAQTESGTDPVEREG